MTYLWTDPDGSTGLLSLAFDSGQPFGVLCRTFARYISRRINHLYNMLFTTAVAEASAKGPKMIRDQETLDQLIDMVSRFVRERLIPAEHKVAEEYKVPDEIIQEMKELGLFGMTIPEEYGGLGLTMEEEIYVAFALGRTSPAFRSILGTNNGIGSAAVVFDGTEEQKQKFLPKYASGEWVGCFCLTEPD